MIRLMQAALLIIAGSLSLPAARAQSFTVFPGSDTVVLRNMVELNSTADDYALVLSLSRRYYFFTSSRRSDYASLYVATAPQGEPSPLTVGGIEGISTDVGSLGIALLPQAELFPLSDRELQALGRLPGSGSMVTLGRNPSNVGDADIRPAFLPETGSGRILEMPEDAINSPAWDAQAALSGDRVIFASTRDGGEGEMDLWEATVASDGTLREVRNLGPTINTDGNECAPFLAADGRTLFFASSGHEGFGGTDIFVSRRTEKGEWSTPLNLGKGVNSVANELFFHGVGTERFHVTSDRAGGVGGLDLYEGSSNIFAAGYGTLRFSLPDTTTGELLGGTIVVRERSLGREVTRFVVEKGSERRLRLPLGGLAYELQAEVPGLGTRQIEVESLAPEREHQVALRFGSTPPLAREDFSLDGVNIPLFVSGYYRVNTRANLDELRNRQKGAFRRLTYITDVTNDSAYALNRDRTERVEAILADFVDSVVTVYLPKWERFRSTGELLEIQVHGFADPRPIIGRYMEEGVSFNDSSGARHRLRTGQALTNFSLAGLRAHYATRLLDEHFSANDLYRRLKKEGLIRWVAVSGNVDALSGGDDLAAKRRIRVVFRRVGT